MATGKLTSHVTLDYRLGIIGLRAWEGCGSEWCCQPWSQRRSGSVDLGQGEQLGLWRELLQRELSRVSVFRLNLQYPSDYSLWRLSRSGDNLLTLPRSTIDLFRSAIIECGAQSLMPIGPAADIWQDAFDLLLPEQASCTTYGNALSHDTTTSPNETLCSDRILRCLRQLSADHLVLRRRTS